MTRNEKAAAELGREDEAAGQPDRGAQIFHRTCEREEYTKAYQKSRLRTATEQARNEQAAREAEKTHEDAV